MSEDIDGLLKQGAESGAVPGIVALAANRDGVIYEGAAGKLTADGADVDTSTMFRIFSMTKAVATVAALQLVEQGRITLDQRVSTIRPEFGNLQVIDGFDDDGQPRFRPPASEATVRQLVTHTSGCGYWITNEDLVKFHEVTGTNTALAGTMDALTGVPLVADPGTEWNYGTGVDWAGLCVESISGRPLDQYLDEFILGPLGMKDTTFSPSDEQRERLMPVHTRGEDGSLSPLDLDLPQEVDWRAGGHGLYGTGPDYLRFLQAILRGGELDGERILEEETVELMFTNQIGDIEVPHVIKSGDPMLTNDIAFPEELGQSWGAGLHLVTDDLPGMRKANTGDWAGIANSYYWIDRDSGVTGATFTQVIPFFDAKVVELNMGFEAAVYAKEGAAVA